MKILNLLSFSAIAMSMVSCVDDVVNHEDLKGSISLQVEVNLKISEISGRTAEISSDTLNVDVYSGDGSLLYEFENLLDFPDTLVLIPGDYYIEVYSDNQNPAAWENPMVYGTSAIITVEAGENYSINVNCSLANVKVTVGYSEVITNNFNTYQTLVTNSDGSLTFIHDEYRAGYFAPEPLTIDVSLTFVSSDGTEIEKSVSGTIDDVQPGTYYNVFIDAELPESKMGIDVTVNDVYNEELITFAEQLDSVEGPISYGSLLITEIMYNPSALSDTDGEWFEIYNASQDSIDLYNLSIRKDAGLAFTVDQQIVLYPDEYFVMGKTSNATIEADYIYGSSLSLTNYGDKVILANYGSDGTNGTVISEVDYGNGTGFPTATGASVNLDPLAYEVELAKIGTNWCLSTEMYETEDLGTPGLPNTNCN